MNRESVELGFVLKQIKDYKFSMQKFEDRLKLQKMIYLLQAFGVYLGYDFSWYLRGPYCSKLAHSGFSLGDTYEAIPDNVELRSKEDKNNFARFQEFIKGKDIDALEIAASLHYLKKVHGESISEEKILKIVTEKRPNFMERQVKGIWKEMKRQQLDS